MILGFLKESLFFLFFYFFLIGIISTDKYITKNNKRFFIFTILLGILHLALDYIGYWTVLVSGNVFIRELTSYTGYSIRPLLILCFMHLCADKYKHNIFCGLSILNLIFYFTSHYTHLFVYFTPDNHFRRGPLGLFVFYLCGAGLISIVIYSVIGYRNHHVRRWIIPPVCSAIVVYAVYLDYKATDNIYPAHLNEILVIVMFLFYVFYHLDLVEQYDEKMLQNQKLQLMVSQIKPHFFFNTITTIQALCSIDPAKASETLGLFASYVRQNITTQTNNLIPFSEEIKHVKTFVAIEMLRFPNIEVLYDFQVTDFDIATLSLQPLVENAIKHGIRSREHGYVTISTKKDKHSIIITIADNGIGFDTTIIDKLDDTHVGINNVKNRLAILQNATMEITSSTDGTTITITIPWEN